MVPAIARVYNASFGLERISRGPFATKMQMTTSNRTGVSRVGFILMAALAFGRLVGARLQFLGFEPAKSGTLNATSDIVKASGLAPGAKWGPLETFRNERFRWVENDAQIRMLTAKSGDVALSMVVASGPEIGSRAFVLKVLDERGRQVSTVQVDNRGRVKFFCRSRWGSLTIFGCDVDDGGKPAHNDPQILNFRVFQISVNPVQSQQHMILSMNRDEPATASVLQFRVTISDSLAIPLCGS
jgi:hypothetical protein